jgi:hypothetical protein
VDVGTSSITIENVSQRLASANHEKTRLNRLYWSSAGAEQKEASLPELGYGGRTFLKSAIRRPRKGSSSPNRSVTTFVDLEEVDQGVLNISHY